MEQEKKNAPSSGTPFPSGALGHYRVLSALGAGGMGVVYRARDTRLERDVALKVLPDALMSSSTARARLVREAKTASALNHPNICHIYEVGEADGHSYIAMEHVGGRPLSQSIPAEGLPSETVLRYAAQLSDALAHAHERNVLHRDMKSANVMVTPEGHVKVLDFGLAKRAVVESDEGAMTIDSVTQAGAVAGTLHYLAPELLRGQPADARSDIWALGVVLFEMATGKFPFSGKTGFEVSAAILREAPQQLPAQVPAGLRGIIGRCLAKEPARRYQRASELRAAVEAISSDITMKLWEQSFDTRSTSPRTEAPGMASGQTPFATTSPAYSTPGRPSQNPEANEYFDKATLFLSWGHLDLRQAEKMLERALQLDPQFGEAHALFGFVMWLLIESGESNDVGLLYRGHEALRRALQADPDSVNARASLAALYLTEGKKDTARREVEKALQINPGDLKANYMLMRCDWLDGEADQAIGIAREALKRVPLFYPGRTLLGQVLREQGQLAEAVQELDKALEQDAKNPWMTRDLARVHLDRGELRQARQTLMRVWPEHRQNFAIRLVWALLLSLEGKKKEALREVDSEVLKYAEASAFALATLAEFYATVGESDQALRWLDRAVRSGDERVEWFRRDPLLVNVREHPRFQQILESIAFRRPPSESRTAAARASSSGTAAPALSVPRRDSAGSAPTLTFEQPRRSKWLAWGGAALMLLLLGGLWYQQSLSQGANDAPPSTPAIPEAAYTGPRVSTGGKASPNAEANAYFEKATLFMRGQFDAPRARELLEKALEADPKFAEARGAYALTHLLQVEGGLSNETAWLYRAEQQLQQALRDDPDCTSAQAILGGLYVLQGKKELGGRQLQEVFKRDPRQLPGRIGLVHYYRMNGDYPAGIAMARETLKLVPVFFISQLLLGNMLHEGGDPPGAVREYGGVLDQDAQNLFALRELARGHIETGDIKTARLFLEKIRESDRRNYRVRLVWALLYAREGKRRDALKEMDVEVQKYAEVNPNVTLEAVEFYAILGDKAKALDWLERAVRNGDERTEWFQRDPLLESIRGEDRFKNLLGSIAYRRQQQKQ